MMGRQEADQGQLFYLFNLERRIPVDHLLRRINPEFPKITSSHCRISLPIGSNISLSL
jgi:hypothetical protein